MEAHAAAHTSATDQRQIEGRGAGLSEAARSAACRVLEAFQPDLNSSRSATSQARRSSARRGPATLRTRSFSLLRANDDRLFRLTPRLLNAGAAICCRTAVSDILQRPRALKRRGPTNPAPPRYLTGDDIMMIAHASPKRIIPVIAQIGFDCRAVAIALGGSGLAGLDYRPSGQFRPAFGRRNFTRFTMRRQRRAAQSRSCKVAKDILRWPIRCQRSGFVRSGRSRLRSSTDGRRRFEHRRP